MKLNDSKLKLILSQYGIIDRKKLIIFLSNNPENLTIDELSRLAELVNNSRVDTAAYYTDSETLKHIETSLPTINKNVIRILEPSVGVGNFLNIVIDKYSYAKKLIIDVNDIDATSLEITKILNRYREIPKNVEINYLNSDFLSVHLEGFYDLIIGNPPFIRLTKEKGLDDLSNYFNDDTTKNIAGFFMQKAINMSRHVIFILPKYFLSNPDFYLTRKRVSKYSIQKIIDFGEKGFKGVLIETIAVFVDTEIDIENTTSVSISKNIINIQSQTNMVSLEYPYWLIYRNNFFDQISKNMKHNVFKVFRDRQITNSILNPVGDIRVIKSRNIKRDGSEIVNIDGYDSYIDKSVGVNLAVWKYYDREDVYLSPNMTYYPRVIKKPKNILVNGSVAILENISNYKVEERHLKFLSSEVFEKYYAIARNYSTRSLNIDSSSVYFFGLYEFVEE